MKRKVWIFVILLILFSCIVVALTEIKVEETELVDLEPKAADPDQDVLIYSFSEPLDENGKWQTDYGDAGEYDIKVTVSDGKLSASEDVLIIVNKKEEPPVINSFYPAEEEIEIFEGNSLNFRVTATDFNNDELSYSWELNGDEVSDTNKFEYFFDYTSEDDYLLKVYVSDGELTTTKQWKINVKNLDRKPMFRPITNIIVKEDQKVTVNLEAEDPDGDKVVFSAENIPSGSSLDGNVFSWLPGYDAVKKEGIVDKVLDKYHLVMDSYVVTFIAKGREKEARQKVRITVFDVNRKPVLDVGDMEVSEEEEFTIKATASDPDGDKLKFSYSGWLIRDTHKPRYGDAGTYNVKVDVSDGWLEDSKTINIDVKKKNRKPVFRKIGKFSVNEGELLRIKLRAKDPDGDEIIFLGGNLTNSSLLDDVFEWTPGYDTVRETSKEVKIKFTASDGVDSAAEEAVVTVKNVNVAPEIVSFEPEEDAVVKRNEPVVFKVEAGDVDGDSLSYKWVFGLFEKYDKIGNTMKRVFSTKGTKKVKVIVSDGEDEVVHEWKVKVE